MRRATRWPRRSITSSGSSTDIVAGAGYSLDHVEIGRSVIQPVILCGGSGTRLWPLSRPERPKPFIELLGDRTLFQLALDRVQDRTRFCEPLVVAGAQHVHWIKQQAGMHSLVVEPAARNTAPAIALAAARLDPATIMLVCPSDHYIADEGSFLEGVNRAAELAKDGWLVCFGIEPHRPETGYGYIERGEPLGPGHRIARFIEKPDAEQAKTFLADGRLAWNGGIFTFEAGTYLAELEKYRPGIAKAVRMAVAEGKEHSDGFHPAPGSFASIKSESVDYAVMEHTERAAVVSLEMGWSDIGTWDALMTVRQRDLEGNIMPDGTRLIDCRGVMVASDGPNVSAIGLDNVIIVVEGDDILVVGRNASQKVARLGKSEGK